MSENKFYGYTGQGLRINLTTGKITTEPTFPRFNDFLGGTQMGYKIFWDEVPPDTDVYSPNNKIAICPGPLSGTGAICSGRTSITTLWPTSKPRGLIASGHCGGELAAKIKHAGYDFIILEGESKSPVYVYIHNEEVQLRDASHIWGQGTYRACETMSRETHAVGSVSAIGPAGENGVPMSNLMVDKSHSCGGIGSILGKKKVKGFVITGDRPLHIHAKPQEWEALLDHHRSIMGALNQCVVSRVPSPLFEFYSPGSRWSGVPGRVWGAANPPVTISDKIRDINHISYRTCSVEYYLGSKHWDNVVRNNGCFSCPIRCYSVMKDEEIAAKYKVRPVHEQVCGALFGRWFFPKLVNDLDHPASFPAAIVGSQTMDDMGVWCNYMQIHRDFRVLYEKGVFKEKLPKEEYESIDWSKIENPDPSILQDIIPRIAHRQGEFGYWMGESTPYLVEHFGIKESDWRKDHEVLYWGHGHTKHHANEDDGQVGCVLNCLYNRDPMTHGHVTFVRSGLPLPLLKKIGAKYWGDESCVDAIGDYKPTNIYKMRRLKWVVARSELHNMLGLCSWTGPWEISPIRENGYIGDIELESKVWNAVVGRPMTQAQLDNMGLTSFIMLRAYTMRQMKTRDLRHKHDDYPDWIFEDSKGKKAFTPGTLRMDRADIEKSFDLFYEVMDFDIQTGSPTEKCLKTYNLEWMIPTLRKEGLI